MSTSSNYRFKAAACFSIMVLLLSIPFCLFPAITHAAGNQNPNSMDVVDIVQGKPYYSPDTAGNFIPAEFVYPPDSFLDNFDMPELLPESLEEQQKQSEKYGQQSERPKAGSGTGGWTTLSRPYTPSSNPLINYYANSGWNYQLDSSGDGHFFYHRLTQTDVSQAPDGAGFMNKNLVKLYYAEHDGSTWSSPELLTPTSGFEDINPLLWEVDSDDYVHLVYSKWTWRRDSTIAAGTAAAYQHSNENIWYRYKAPSGAWSTPVQLTNFPGFCGLLGGEFVLVNGRIHGSWFETKINETVPATYQGQVNYIGGYLNNWGAVENIVQWDYNNDPGQQMPEYWTNTAASEQGGEAAVTYGIFTNGAAPVNAKSDIYGVVRSPDGTWAGPTKLTAASAGNHNIPLFQYYSPTDNRLRLLSIGYKASPDAAHPPQQNWYLNYHQNGTWTSPLNLTGSSSTWEANAASMRLDPFGYLHMPFTNINRTWDGANWVTTGGSLNFTRENESGFDPPLSVLGYQAQRYVEWADTGLDANGGEHLSFISFRYDGVNFWDYAVFYSVNHVLDGIDAFTSTKLRSETANTVFDTWVNCRPGNQVKVVWGEKRVDGGTGEPQVGALFSRNWDGSSWSGLNHVSGVPGSTDLLHVVEPSWPVYYDIDTRSNGEFQCLFETAKYNVGTGTYYDFNKYFTETINGRWSAPELISDAAFSGEYPSIHLDSGERIHAVYDVIDPATNKETVYASMQNEPTPPASVFFFAEGTTRPGFEEWLCIQNPGGDEANVLITYMLGTGDNIEQPIVVPGHTRTTVSVNDAVGSGQDVSARVEADNLIVAERPMYFDYYGWPGGHDSIGVQNPGRLWYFAEGTTRPGFSEYLTIQNPSEHNATVTVTYILGDGSTIDRQIVVGATSRATVDVNAEVGPGQDVSMRVSSPDVAIVAERPQYFNYNGLTGGHDSPGSQVLGNRWYFAEGTTRAGFDTYICVQNPTTTDALVDFSFILGDGSLVAHQMAVPSTSRQTLKVNDVVGPEQDVSTVVNSNTEVLVERPMYFNYHGALPGGHDVLGTNSPKIAWYFAEGSTLGGFEEWLSLENPGNEDTTATLSFMLDDGTVHDAIVGIPAHTRITFDVGAEIGLGRNASVEVWSQRSIIVERPMYFMYHGAWPGGHVVIGL